MAGARQGRPAGPAPADPQHDRDGVQDGQSADHRQQPHRDAGQREQPVLVDHLPVRGVRRRPAQLMVPGDLRGPRELLGDGRQERCALRQLGQRPRRLAERPGERHPGPFAADPRGRFHAVRGEDVQAERLRGGRQPGQPHRVDEGVGGEGEVQRLELAAQRGPAALGGQPDRHVLPAPVDVRLERGLEAAREGEVVGAQPVVEVPRIGGGQPGHVERAEPLTSDHADAGSGPGRWRTRRVAARGQRPVAVLRPEVVAGAVHGGGGRGQLVEQLRCAEFDRRPVRHGHDPGGPVGVPVDRQPHHDLLLRAVPAHDGDLPADHDLPLVAREQRTAAAGVGRRDERAELDRQQSQQHGRDPPAQPFPPRLPSPRETAHASYPLQHSPYPPARITVATTVRLKPPLRSRPYPIPAPRRPADGPVSRPVSGPGSPLVSRPASRPVETAGPRDHYRLPDKRRADVR